MDRLAKVAVVVFSLALIDRCAAPFCMPRSIRRSVMTKHLTVGVADFTPVELPRVSSTHANRRLTVKTHRRTGEVAHGF